MPLKFEPIALLSVTSHPFLSILHCVCTLVPISEWVMRWLHRIQCIRINALLTRRHQILVVTWRFSVTCHLVVFSREPCTNMHTTLFKQNLQVNWHISCNKHVHTNCRLIKITLILAKTYLIVQHCCGSCLGPVFAVGHSNTVVCSKFALQTWPQVGNFGVILDSHLNFRTYFISMANAAFYHLCNIAKLGSLLS